MKLLEIELVCTGHDSENHTDNREMTLMGYPRNVIPGKNGRFVILCYDCKGYSIHTTLPLRVFRQINCSLHVTNQATKTRSVSVWRGTMRKKRGED